MRSAWRTAPIRGWSTNSTIRRCAPISASRPSCRTVPRTTGRAGSAAEPSPATTRSRRRCMCAIRMSGRAKSTSVVHAAKIRLSETVDARSARQVAEALEVWRDGMDARQAALAVADTLEALYTRIGVPTRLRQLRYPARGPARHRQRNGEELQRQRGRALGTGTDRRCDAAARGGILKAGIVTV